MSIYLNTNFNKYYLNINYNKYYLNIISTISALAATKPILATVKISIEFLSFVTSIGWSVSLSIVEIVTLWIPSSTSHVTLVPFFKSPTFTPSSKTWKGIAQPLIDFFLLTIKVAVWTVSDLLSSFSLFF